MTRKRPSKANQPLITLKSILSARPEIDAAVADLMEHRFVFDALLQDQGLYMDCMFNLFSGELFLSMQFTVEDIQWLFEQPVYLKQYMQIMNSDEQDFSALVLVLMNRKGYRQNIAAKMLNLLPAMVSQKKYQDAWLVYHSVHYLLKGNDHLAPVAIWMFDRGMEAWRTRAVELRDLLLERVGIDEKTIADKGIIELNALIKEAIEGKDEEKILEGFGAYYRIIEIYTLINAKQIRQKVIALIGKEDSPLLLTDEEVNRWLPEILKLFEAQYHFFDEEDESKTEAQAYANEKFQGMVLTLAEEMSRDIFTPERQEKLVADLKDYHDKMLVSGEKEKAQYADAAVWTFTQDAVQVRNSFLVAICVAELQSGFDSIVEQMQEKKQKETSS